MECKTYTKKFYLFYQNFSASTIFNFSTFVGHRTLTVVVLFRNRFYLGLRGMINYSDVIVFAQGQWYSKLLWWGEKRGMTWSILGQTKGLNRGAELGHWFYCFFFYLLIFVHTGQKGPFGGSVKNILFP